MASNSSNFFSQYIQRQVAHWISVFVLPEDTYHERAVGNATLKPWLKAQVHEEPQDADFVILNGVLQYEQDIQATLEQLRAQIQSRARLMVVYYSAVWRPIIQLMGWLGLRSRTSEENWLDHGDMANLLNLAGFEIVRRDNRLLLPFYVPGISWLVNRWLAPLPLLNSLCLSAVVIARPRGGNASSGASVSVVVPARNEEGNIAEIVRRFRPMSPQDELIFVEGNSKDNTWAEIQRVLQIHQETAPFRIVVAQQEGKGKGDAVRKGFAMARNDVLMILDADLTVSPEELPKFHRALISGDADFVNGSRMVYPQENQAMRFLNMLGNKAFAIAFTFVLGQRFKDTLCGTKVLWRRDYERLAERRWFFGDFDPFGDFDLILGASRLALKVAEVPIRYRSRTYGETNISRWTHGWLLLRMTWYAARRIKFV